jgi:hypothetical protein
MPAPPESTRALNDSSGGQDGKPDMVQSYRTNIDGHFLIVSDHPLVHLHIFGDDLTVQIGCEEGGTTTLTMVPAPGRELPAMLMSDDPGGPMTPGNPTPEGHRLFEVKCGISVGLTWDPKRTHSPAAEEMS